MKAQIHPAAAAHRRRQLLTSALLTLLLLLLLAADARAQAPAAATTESIVVTSKVLGEDRPILVRTPPGYAARTGERFPVLYMTDGDAHMQHTSATLAFLARNGRMPEMI